MPYITKEEVKEKRNLLKKAYPNLKLSVTRNDGSEIYVCIMAGNVDFNTTNEPVNTYYINDSDYSKEAKETLEGIADIVSKGVSTESEDGDYGSIPSFYFNLRIGKWDKDYILKS